MAGTSLLSLLDDIATLLDDIAVMSKVAAKKTAGVLGDDLALNAQQVTGVSAEREIPVVWAVAKGSYKNKAILVPAAILISLFIPWAITPLLMIGGAYLCFEGAEKVFHKFFHNPDNHHQAHQSKLEALANPAVDLVAFEQKKIKGAIRTDFILSAEIIAITLGTVANAPLMSQVSVLIVIALVMTTGVYGLVAGLVKIDDLGLHLYQAENATPVSKKLGALLLAAAPKIMKFLSIAGTIAMFLVGGGILVHGIPALHHSVEHWQEAVSHTSASIAWLHHLLPTVVNGGVGIVAGLILALVITKVSALFKQPKQH